MGFSFKAVERKLALHRLAQLRQTVESLNVGEFANVEGTFQFERLKAARTEIKRLERKL